MDQSSLLKHDVPQVSMSKKLNPKLELQIQGVQQQANARGPCPARAPGLEAREWAISRPGGEWVYALGSRGELGVDQSEGFPTLMRRFWRDSASYPRALADLGAAEPGRTGV